MVQRYAHLAPADLVNAVERLVVAPPTSTPEPVTGGTLSGIVGSLIRYHSRSLGIDNRAGGVRSKSRLCERQ
jgi:hypothetical protein